MCQDQYNEVPIQGLHTILSHLDMIRCYWIEMLKIYYTCGKKQGKDFVKGTLLGLPCCTAFTPSVLSDNKPLFYSILEF